MIDSRDLLDLTPDALERAVRHQRACEREGIQIIFTSTYRDNECQAMLYAKGRTTKGPNVRLLKPMGDIVTNAGPGESFHNYRVAYDVVPIVHGKAVWNDDKLWERIGILGEQQGLQWAGRWKGKLREKAHFQLPVTLKELRAYGAKAA